MNDSAKCITPPGSITQPVPRFNLAAFDGLHPTKKLCVALAAALVFLLFGDVVLGRASLAPIDYIDVLADPGQEARTVSWIPSRSERTIYHGQGDIGAAAFQMEPAQKFLAFCLRHRESPYWDPYTATGALGPETLVDIKFSPLSVLVALLGGGSRVLSFVLVAEYLLSCYCLLRVCCVEMELSVIAGLAACCIYFLNGFALANLYTQMAQPYFLAPLLLRSLLLVSRRPTPWHSVLALGAHIMFIATTFFPTAVLAGFVVYGASLAIGMSENWRCWRQLLLIHTAIPVAAILSLSFLYLPIFAAYFTYLDTFAQYRARSTPGTSLINLLSLFTPKHLWESYRAMRRPAVPPVEVYDPWIHHLGIIGPLLAVQAFSCKSRLRIPAAILGLYLLTAVGQIFGIFPFTLLDSLPFFSFIRNEYWSCMAALALVLLVAIGWDSITDQNAFSYPSIVLIGTIACAFFVLYGRVGVAPDKWTQGYVTVFWCIIVVAAALLIAARLPRFTHYSKIALVGLLLAEGMFYMNTMRPYRSRRDEKLAPSIQWLTSTLVQHPGSRILNIGVTGIFPNWGSALQIPELGDLNSGELPWYRNYYDTYIGQGIFMSLMGHPYPDDKLLFTDASLSLPGVRYIVVDRGVNPAIRRLDALRYSVVRQDPIRVIYENPNPMPRSFAVAAIRKGSGLPPELGDAVRTVALTADEAFAHEANRIGVPNLDSTPRPSQTQLESPGEIQIESYHHTKIKLQCLMRRAGIVVLTDSWNPNWTATLDGRTVPVGMVDVAFRGIAVEAGKHEIIYTYTAPFLVFGETLSMMSILVFFGLVYGWHRRERAPGWDLARVNSAQKSALWLN